jgi:hypothetical protein
MQKMQKIALTASVTHQKYGDKYCKIRYLIVCKHANYYLWIFYLLKILVHFTLSWFSWNVLTHLDACSIKVSQPTGVHTDVQASLALSWWQKPYIFGFSTVRPIKTCYSTKKKKMWRLPTIKRMYIVTNLDCFMLVDKCILSQSSCYWSKNSWWSEMKNKSQFKFSQISSKILTNAHIKGTLIQNPPTLSKYFSMV